MSDEAEQAGTSPPDEFVTVRVRRVDAEALVHGPLEYAVRVGDGRADRGASPMRLRVALRDALAAKASPPIPAPDYRADAERLAEALRWTQEYIGDDLLPPLEGWSWFDALKAHEAIPAPTAGSEARETAYAAAHAAIQEEFDERGLGDASLIARVAVDEAFDAVAPAESKALSAALRKIKDDCRHDEGEYPCPVCLASDALDAAPLNQHVTGDESSPAGPLFDSDEEVDAFVASLHPCPTCNDTRRVRMPLESSAPSHPDAPREMDCPTCQGTSHEQVIPAAEFAKGNEAWHERVQRAVDEIPRGEFIPAAKLREFIEAQHAVYAWPSQDSGRRAILNRLTAWLDEHTTQPTAPEPVQADLRGREAAMLEIAAAQLRYALESDEPSEAMRVTLTTAQNALRVAMDACHVCGGVHWTDAEAGGQCINCGTPHPNMSDEAAEDHESGPASSTTDGPASPREGST